MTVISSAVNENVVSAIVGYDIQGILEDLAPGNLPQRIAVIAEANNANQSNLPDSINFTKTTDISSVMGYGSPGYLAARILRPFGGDSLGSIPTIMYPVAEASGAVAASRTFTITGTATGTATHLIRVNGRTSLDGAVYQFVVETGDTAAEIAPKIEDAINNVIGSPCIGSVSTNQPVFTSKWAGISSEELNIEFVQNGNSVGITYAQTATTAGAGAPSISTVLSLFGEEWNTLVINCIGTDSTTLDAYEAFNGNPNDRTGRYVPTVFLPCKVFSGSNDTTLAEYTAITNARKNSETNVIVPLPNTKAFTFEGAAETVFYLTPLAQNTPHRDLIGTILTDTPGANNSGDFSDPGLRDSILKIGSSTVKLNAGRYEIVDLATTSHPDDEPQTAVLYRWVRDWIINMNIRYKYLVLERIHVVGKTLLADESESTQTNTISPNRWRSKLNELADQLEADALISSAQEMKDSIRVGVSSTNANRFETKFRVTLTGVARVSSTTSQFTFNFGG